MKTLLIAIVLGIATATAAAEGTTNAPLAAGRERFLNDCATCHGVDGGGRGPVAAVLKITPPDLTRIASRHHGNFPYPDVYAAIDGRNLPLAHGTQDMPIWGDRYKEPLPATGEKRVRQRIDELVRYLESIQQP